MSSQEKKHWKWWQIVLLHLLLFVLLETGFVFGAEPLLQWLMPDTHNLTFFFLLFIVGSVTIFMITLISCLIFLVFRRGN